MEQAKSEASENGILVEINTFFTGVELDDDVVFGEEHSTAAFDAELAGCNATLVLVEWQSLHIPAHVEVEKLGTTRQTDAQWKRGHRGVLRHVAETLQQWSKYDTTVTLRNVVL